MLLLALTACCAGRQAAAGGTGEPPEFSVRTWTRVDGLPEGSVNAVFQTRDGYLWIGTTAGLVRFDGVRFTEVPLVQLSAGFIPHSSPVSVTALCDDGSGRLWVGTQEDGLFCVEGGTATRFGKADGLLDGSVTCLANDADGRLWVGTRRGANRWDGHGFAGFTRDDGLPDDAVSGIHATRSGAVWITTRGGMCSFAGGRISPFEFPAANLGRNPEFLDAYEDQRGNLWAFGATYLINLTEGKRLNYFLSDQPSSVRIWSLCEGRDGRLWIGTSGRGLFWFDGNRFQPVTLGEAPWGNDVRAICGDREGNLWLGLSEGGLARLRPQRSVLIKPAQGLPAGPANCLALDPVGRVVAGLERGGAFINLGRRFEELLDRSEVAGKRPGSTLCAGADGTLWLGTPGSGLYALHGGRAARFTTANGLGDDYILALCPETATDGRGSTRISDTIWAGTRAGTLHRLRHGGIETFNAEDGLSGAPITALHPGRGEKSLWIGTADGTLLRREKESFRKVRIAPELAGKAVLALFEDAAGRVWIGSRGGGLGCLEEGRSAAWGPREGLPDDIVSGLVDDADGNLWMVTGKGVWRVRSSGEGRNPKPGSPLQVRLVYEPASGDSALSTSHSALDPAGGPRALRSADGLLWFATPDGVVKVNPTEWAQDGKPPQVHLEGLTVNNQQLTLRPSRSKPIRMPANVRNLEIQFTALSFAAPEKLRFRYRLEGFDTEWVTDSSTERRARYGRLPGGRYDFRVTACSGDGAWSEEGATLAFVVPTPLWRAPAFLGMCGVAVAGGIVGVVRLVSHRRLRRRLERLQEQQAMERERVRIARDMHDEIGSKLTKISFLSEHAKVELREGSGKPGLEETARGNQTDMERSATARGVERTAAEGAAVRSLANKIESIADTSREVLQALDEIVWAVNPRNDTLEHLAAYLGQYATEYFQDTPLECELQLPAQLRPQPMSAEVRHNVFLAFEESLNNILKHSGASRVRIEITAIDGEFRVTVSDNGRGFAGREAVAESKLERGSEGEGRQDAGAPARGGNGLNNMRQRLAGIGGECRIQTSHGAGTSVRFSIPLKEPRAGYAASPPDPN